MIIGIGLKSIKAHSEGKVIQKVDVQSTPTIKSIEKRDILNLNDVLSIGFSFSISYKPDIGSIDFEGEVLCQTELAEKALELWKAEARLDDGIAQEVLNAIFRKCLTHAVSLADELKLPPPVSFPVVKKKG